MSLENSGVFNASWISNGGPLYRVYIRRDQAFFIKLGRSDAQNYVIALQFGLLGALIASYFKKRAAKKRVEVISRIDRLDPDQVVTEDKHHMRFTAGELTDNAIEPCSIWVGRGAGIWRFTTPKGKKMKFLIEKKEEMLVALDVLPKLLGGNIWVEIDWDEEKQKYVKRRI